MITQIEKQIMQFDQETLDKLKSIIENREEELISIKSNEIKPFLIDIINRMVKYNLPWRIDYSGNDYWTIDGELIIKKLKISLSLKREIICCDFDKLIYLLGFDVDKETLSSVLYECLKEHELKNIIIEKLSGIGYHNWITTQKQLDKMLK